MRLLAIDPGPVESGFVIVGGVGPHVITSDTWANDRLLLYLRTREGFLPTAAVFEQIAPMGQVVGRSVFETAFWTGRFYQALASRDVSPLARIPRVDVKRHLVGSVKAKDKDVRAACLARLGPVGTSKEPGPCFGVTGDAWQALGLSLVFWDRSAQARAT